MQQILKILAFFAKKVAIRLASLSKMKNQRQFFSISLPKKQTKSFFAGKSN